VFQVLERTKPVEKRQFVLYTEEIKPSDATVRNIRSQAMQLQAESASAQDLMDNAAKNGIQVMQGKDITSMASSIQQLQNARELISWAFNESTKVDDVSDVYNLNNNSSFVVAAVRGMKQKGKPQLESVREAIETELTAMKKLELVEKTIADEMNSSSIQQIAEKYQLAVMDSVTLTFGGESYQNRGIENAAIGKIFTLPVGKPSVVTGKNNVYAVSVYEVNAPADPSPNYAMEKSSLKNVVAGRGRTDNAILDGLKEKANILDQRYLFFAR
jgi:peptidyl-prolyl cis-trans isomerase D